MSTAIVWLRRDLRVHDNPSLVAALATHERVVPAFVLDPVLVRGRFASAPRTAFMLDCPRLARRQLAVDRRVAGRRPRAERRRALERYRAAAAG
jgi:deoxyribodipyrimidine photo-lyase